MIVERHPRSAARRNRIEAFMTLGHARTNAPFDRDGYYLGVAISVSMAGDCRRRQVGCVLVDQDKRIIGTGYNGAPSGVPGCLSGACPRGLLSYEELAGLTTSYDEGPGACIAVHAEANALLYARTSCKGATAYITDPPCPTCLRLLEAAGVERIVTP